MRRQLSLLLLALWPLLSPRASAAEPSRVGEVLRVRQSVAGGPAGGEESSYKELKEKEAIPGGTRVVTRPRAGAAILFEPEKGPRGLVQLGPDTSLTFEEESVDKISDVLKGIWNIRIELGRFYAMFAKKGAPDEGRITISTPNGLVTLRGTAVYLDVARDGSTSIFVLEGSVTVQAKGGGEVTVPAGQQTFLAAGESPSPPAPFDATRERGSDLLMAGTEFVLAEPPLIVFDDPRFSLPK